MHFPQAALGQRPVHRREGAVFIEAGSGLCGLREGGIDDPGQNLSGVCRVGGIGFRGVNAEGIQQVEHELPLRRDGITGTEQNVKGVAAVFVAVLQYDAHRLIFPVFRQVIANQLDLTQRGVPFVNDSKKRQFLHGRGHHCVTEGVHQYRFPGARFTTDNLRELCLSGAGQPQRNGFPVLYMPHHLRVI